MVISAEILKLLINLKNKLGLTYLFITHDLGVAWHIAERIAIMYLGEIVELGSIRKVLANPLHPYTQLLISSVPNPKMSMAFIQPITQTEIPSAINPPPGCKFHPRCPKATRKCMREKPYLQQLEPEHIVACHQYI
ncbi:MAG: ABC transporter ATP-binding protein [Candidatus Methanomethylicia archaeon]